MEIIVKNADFSTNRIGVVEEKIYAANFNGTSSYAQITAITLSENGDYIEFLLNVDNSDVGHYFALRELWTYPVLGIAKTKLSLRLNNQTWAVNNQSISISDVTNVKIKISYESTDVKVYIDDTLKFTYDNSVTQAGLTFLGFGKYGSTPDFWKGSIKKLRTNKYNSGDWVGVNELPGWAANDVVLT